MLEIKNTEIAFLDRAIRASKNPMLVGEINTSINNVEPNIETVKKLASAEGASGHDHFLCGIDVCFDVKYPQYWTIEAERYHWFDIVSSQSKMHRLTMMGKEESFHSMFNKYVSENIIDIVKIYIEQFNYLLEYEEIDGIFSHPTDSQTPIFTSREIYENTKYETFMKIISNLPCGFEMWMTVKTNYLQLKTMYNQRRTHKLKEDWGEFCDWCEKLPRFIELIKRRERDANTKANKEA